MDSSTTWFWIIFLGCIVVLVAILVGTNQDIQWGEPIPKVSLLLSDDLSRMQELATPYKVLGRLTLRNNVTFIGFLFNPREYKEIVTVSWGMLYLEGNETSYIGVEGNRTLQLNPEEVTPFYFNAWLSNETPFDIQERIKNTSIVISVTVVKLEQN